jgi:uncharacterized membrane protein
MKTWPSRPEIRIALAVGAFLVVHVAIVNEAYPAAVLTGIIYAGANLAVNWRNGMGAGNLYGWLAAVLVLLLALIAIWMGYVSAVALLLAPSLLANAFMLFVFGRTLLPGREPLITRFRRFDVGHVAPKFAAYTRRLTALWTVLFAAGTAASLVAALMRDIEIWSWVAFILLPALTAALFLGEHVYRAFRYGPEGRASPLHTLALMFQPQAWLQPAHQSQSKNARHG